MLSNISFLFLSTFLMQYILYMPRLFSEDLISRVIIIHNAFLNQVLKLNVAFMPGDKVGFGVGKLQWHTQVAAG